jgi:nucleoside-specific outer membrane channel protein Tsx
MIKIDWCTFIKRYCYVVCGFILSSFAQLAWGGGAALWSSTNIQYLYGSSYSAIYFDEAQGKLDSKDEEASVMTLEHVNGWKYGDNFYFVDVFNPDREGEFNTTSFYGEVSPRLSFSKISGAKLEFGIIQDVLITTTAELGAGMRNYLYGIAMDFKIPHTPVAQLNWYIRNEMGPGKDTGQQITLVWMTPFSIGNTAWSFEGFFDYAYGMDHAEDNIITAPRLLLDISKLYGAAGTLQLGMEYQIWRNKYGLDGIDEDVPQIMLKWIW